MLQDDRQTQRILEMLDDVRAWSRANRAAAGLPPYELNFDHERLLEENLVRSAVARRQTPILLRSAPDR